MRIPLTFHPITANNERGPLNIVNNQLLFFDISVNHKLGNLVVLKRFQKCLYWRSNVSTVSFVKTYVTIGTNDCAFRLGVKVEISLEYYYMLILTHLYSSVELVLKKTSFPLLFSMLYIIKTSVTIDEILHFNLKQFPLALEHKWHQTCSVFQKAKEVRQKVEVRQTSRDI